VHQAIQALQRPQLTPRVRCRQRVEFLVKDHRVDGVSLNFAEAVNFGERPSGGLAHPGIDVPSGRHASIQMQLYVSQSRLTGL
jgi:hypothetical protein